MQRAVLLLSLLVVFGACHRSSNCTKKLICAHKSIIPVLGGFDSTKMDTVVVYTYAPDSTFSTVLTEKVYTHPQVLTVSGATNDTTAWYYDSLSFQVGQDYRVSLPAAGVSYKFYHIIDTGSFVNVPCDNAVTSCFSVIYNCTVTGNNSIYASGSAAVYVMLKP